MNSEEKYRAAIKAAQEQLDDNLITREEYDYLINLATRKFKKREGMKCEYPNT